MSARSRTETFRYTAEGWGVGELWAKGRQLVWHELPRPADGPSARGGEAVILSDIADRLTAHFAGEEVSFGDVVLDLSWCTAFQQSVVSALRGIPRGATVTYGELAALAGHPGAQRAVGTFCAGNRFPIVVPCHRVIAADGIGGYGSLGVEYKRRLLRLEGAL